MGIKMFICQFCERICKNSNQGKNHQLRCQNNPDRKVTRVKRTSQQKLNQSLRNKENNTVQHLQKWRANLSDADKLKISEQNRKRNLTRPKKINEQISKTIQQKVKKGEWHTSVAKKMRYEYKGYVLHGKWELAYAKWLDHNNIVWQKCSESFSYTFEGKYRKYTPDFYLVELDEYVEIKGYETEKDKAKWSQFPIHRKLKVLKKRELEELNII